MIKIKTRISKMENVNAKEKIKVKALGFFKIQMKLINF